MKSFFLMGNGINGKYISDKEVKFGGGILRVNDILEVVNKYHNDYNIIKTDDKHCKAKRYYDNKNIISLLNKENIIYPINYDFNDEDILIVVDKGIESSFLKSKIRKYAYIDDETFKDKYCNTFFVVNLNDLDINDVVVEDIIKKLKKTEKKDKTIYINSNTYIYYDGENFHIYYHHKQLENILDLNETFLTGLALENDIDKGIRLGIKLRYFYANLGYVSIDDIYKKVMKEDFDIEYFLYSERKETKEIADNRIAYNIIRYGNDSIRIPYLKTGTKAIFENKIWKEHLELKANLNKAPLFILLYQEENQNGMSYLYDYFSKEIFYDINEIDVVIDIILSRNIKGIKPVFVYNKIDEKIMSSLLEIKEKGLYIRNNQIFLIKEFVVIVINHLNEINFDYLIHSPSLHDTLNRAVFIRSLLKNKASNIFLDSECNIDDDVIGLLLNAKYIYNELSLEKIFSLIDFNNIKYLSINDLPNEVTLNRFLQINTYTLIDELAEKISLILKKPSGKEEKEATSKLLDRLKELKIYFREAKHPMDFSFTDSEIEKLSDECSFLTDKTNKKYIIKNLSRIFKELGYEFYST